MKWAILTAIPILWWLGGQKKLSWARDILVPILIGLGITLKGHPWLGLICCATFQTCRIGYGNYEPGEKNSFLGNLTKDRNGWWIRLVYGFLVAFAGSLPLILGKALTWYLALGYVALNAILGYLVSKLRLPVLLCDLLVGFGFATVLFLLH